MRSIFDQINQKTLMILLAGITLLVLATSSVYAILPQVKAMKSGLATRAELKQLVSNQDALEDQKKKLLASVEQRRRDLRGDMANLPEKKMEAYIIGELQNISWKHNINLAGVKPMQGEQIQTFQELLFKVQLSGEYFDLYDWLQELRNQLGFIVIKSIQINPFRDQSDQTRLSMKLTIASYKNIE